ncbi:retrovirus-related pol polyprotein from transposon TNT 1-94 [Tanacetum coccineum]
MHLPTRSDERQIRNLIQCRNCNKYGHKDVDCWSKPKTDSVDIAISMVTKMLIAGANRKLVPYNVNTARKERLFMAYSPVNAPNTENNVWYIDSGCSNHMCGARSMFKELDESQRKEVTLGNDWKMKVEGKGSVAIKTTQGCVYGKQSRPSFPVGNSMRAAACLDLIHSDLCGPMSVDSIGGSRYFLLFIDDYSRMSWVYFLKNKSEAFDYFKKFKSYVEKQKCLSIN